MSADYGDGQLGIYLGQGHGNFSDRLSISVDGNLSSVLSADFNGDGFDDLVAIDSTVGIYISHGDGTFDGRLALNSNGASLGDFNGDGKIDLISNNSGTSGIYVGRGDGTFESFKTFDGTFSGGEVADFNGDGVLDFLGSGISFGKTEDGASPLLSFSLRTQYDASKSLAIFQNKFNVLSIQRGQLGAFQSRITTAMSVLQSSTENFKAAESRIRDADVAKDSADLTRLQILQQAGISVLSQANLQPQIALKLLQS